MTSTDAQLRAAFRKTDYIPVKIVPDGLLVDERTLDALRGRIVHCQIRRKLFADDGTLDCHSPDGVTAADGRSCEECLHPRCRPWLRIHLASAHRRYILDLASTSARNLFEIEDQLGEEGNDLYETPLELCVQSHGHWGEVVFIRL